MSKFLIGLDDGHGMETAGKRTCPLKEDVVFRGKTYKKGSIIHENDFNENLMELLEKELDRCGINHIQLAPGDTDISLSNRVKRANSNKCDLVVSLHANALSGTKWQEKAYGLVVIHTVNCSTKSKTLAKNCYEHLSKEIDWYSNGGTKYGVRADKDISGYTLYILRQTTMPAVLIEYGFMDNWEDVKVICSDKFQKSCAIATAKGICETLGVKYIAENTTSSNNKVNVKDFIVRIKSDTLNIRKGPGTNYKKISTVKKGDAYTITHTNKLGTWGYLKSGVGWISLGSSYVTKL